MKREEIAARNAIIAERRMANESMKDISKEFELSEAEVSRICSKFGLGGKRSNKKAVYHPKRPETVAKIFIQEEARRADVVRERCDGYEYVGNYTGSDGTADIRCVLCGELRTVSWISIKHRKVGQCPICRERKKEIDRIEKSKAKAEKKRKQEEDRKALYERMHVKHTCPVCGKTFVGHERLVYCSAECRRQANNRYASKRKDKRFTGYARIHWRDIYRMTGSMTCALCGQECDVNDYTTLDDGTIVCGENYPSVDHIIPAARGGTDTWDNVQIAHRGCNSKKWAHSPVIFLSEQASFLF